MWHRYLKLMARENLISKMSWGRELPQLIFCQLLSIEESELSLLCALGVRVHVLKKGVIGGAPVLH